MPKQTHDEAAAAPKPRRARRQRANVSAASFMEMHPTLLDAKCAGCGEQLQKHFDGERWIGCPTAKRATGIIFIPPTMIVPELGGAFALAHPNAPAVPQPTEPVTAAALVPAADDRPARTRKTFKRVPAATAKDGTRGRGRVAGAYVTKGNEPAKMSDSMRKVYAFVAKHKDGVAAKDIVAKTGLAIGTVGWALRQLSQHGAVAHQAAA